ncbi:MAG: CAP domain-containing protein [Selenomonadaceae bacterium]|nr:CAP domain-containing protein [Selenomonadaceae bacterium]
MMNFPCFKTKLLLFASALALTVGAVPPTVYPVAYAAEAEPTEAEIDAYMNELVDLAWDALQPILQEGTSLSSPDIKPKVKAGIWRLAKERGYEDLTDEMVSDLTDGIIGVAWEVFPSGTIQPENSGNGSCDAPAAGNGSSCDGGEAPGNTPSAGNQAGNVSPQSSENVSDYAQAVLDEVNRNRQEHGLSPLVLAEDLCYDADIRAQEIVTVFSHTRPDGSSCFSIIQGGYRKVAENIAAGHATAQETVEQWMNSPGHRANILDPQLEELGVGYCNQPGSEYQHYWVQLFRTR